MVIAGLVRDQVVEVKVPSPKDSSMLASFGTGYLITPSLVLTAAHVVEGFQSADAVFSARQPDDPPRIPADVAWTGRNCDIVLLRVRWPGGAPPWEVTPALLGDVPQVSSEIPFEAFGFPESKNQELAVGGRLRDGDRVPGLILAERNVKTGKLDLRLTVDPGGAYGAWMGFSGAAVFAYGFLVGVVTAGETRTPRLVAGRIAVPAGECWALDPSFVEPDESVTRFRELLAQDGEDVRVSPARRRPDYMRTVQDLRPAGGLVDRAADLAELRAFVHPGSADGDHPYADWVGDAWAGKTALAAEFASEPPPGADVVAFFVSRARTAQAKACWKETCDQLAALLNEPLPLEPDEFNFSALWERAGRDAEQNGRRLVLLIDGLDENDHGQRIAPAIPEDGDRTRRIIVFRREEPALRLRRGHPLTDPRTRVRRMLATSRRASDRSEEAESVLENFLHGERAGVLGVLAAAGPISATDIAGIRRAEDTALTMDAELIAAERITPVLRDAVHRGLIWPLADDPERFAFQHDTLLKLTTDQLGGAIRAHRDAIKRWAAGYAARNWPADTPSYLLVGYPALLTDLADAPGLAALAGPARAARLRASTGDDAATVDELASAVRLLATGGPDAQPDLAAACGLAFRREQLLDALTRYPLSLIEAHAALGHWQRAERIAAHQGQPAAQVSGLTTVAAAAATAGEVRRADELFAAALHALTAIGNQDLRYSQRKALATAAAANGRLLDPQIVRDDYADTSECASALLDFAVAYAGPAGLIDYAEQFMNETCGAEGPVARSAAAAAQIAKTTSSNAYGEPGSTFTDVATPQAATQNNLNIISSVSTAAQIVVRAAARMGRLDAAVRVAAILPQNLNLLALLGEACRTVTDAFPETQLTGLFGDARAAADALPDPVQRAVTLTILAAAASGHVAADMAVAARTAKGTIADPARQAQVGDIVDAAAMAGRPVPELIAEAQPVLAGVADPAQRAAALAILAQTAAAAGQPVDEIITTAGAAALTVPDPSARALTIGAVAQAAAATAQLAMVQSLARGTSDASVLRWIAGLRQAAPGDLSLLSMTLGGMTDDASRAAQLRDLVTARAPAELAGARSVAAILTKTAAADARTSLAQAAATPLAVRFSEAARQAAAGITDPALCSWTLGALAHGFAACGLLAPARSIADGLPDADQRAWAYGAIAQAAAAARQPVAELLTAARDLAATIADPSRRAWTLGVLAETAAGAGEADAGRSIAAEMDDQGQRAWALGLNARAAAAAGQPADNFIAAARDAARAIDHPVLRAWALAQAASDAALCAQPDVAAELLAEAEQAALAGDPVLRAALLAAISQASSDQPERAALLFAQACQEADVPDPVQRAMALAEIARFAPGRPGWSEHIAAQADEVAKLTDPRQRAAVLPLLLRAASRSGDDRLARSVADQMTTPADRLIALLLLARSAAVRGDHPGAEALGQTAARLVTDSGPDAPWWATAAIENTAMFCGSLNAAKVAADTTSAGRFGSGYKAVEALIRAEATAVIPAESADALAIADAARRNDVLSLSRTSARSVSDPTRRAYLLAAIAEAELAAGKPSDAAETLALLPPPAMLADRPARSRVLAVSVAVATAGGGTEPAKAALAAGLTDSFGPELVRTLAVLEPRAIERLTAELGIRPAETVSGAETDQERQAEDRHNGEH